MCFEHVQDQRYAMQSIAFTQVIPPLNWIVTVAAASPLRTPEPFILRVRV